jgi:molybdopterin/thiamine biosynthesis adenylyltransferase/proteasome lid subunit RPN8/RPN11
MTIAFPEPLWAELCGSLNREVETAAVVIAGTARAAGRVTLLARSIHWVPEGSYRRRERLSLEIESHGYVPALKRAAEDGSVAIFFHTHPGGQPAPSEYDMVVDTQLRDLFQLRTGQPLYASLILGGSAARPSFSAKIYTDGHEAAVRRVRVVGGRLRILRSTRDNVDSDVFDRQIRAFGRDGQALLKSLRIGVVGMGGTGSTVFEQLVRLGVGELTVIDDDVVTASNLTRIHESGIGDLDAAKVDVARVASERIGLKTKVMTINNRITALDAARALVHCDIVFGCTDDNRGRAILSRLAYWYLIPVIDTAFLVDSAGEQVRGLFGRVTTVTPGTACLFCRNRINQAQLAAEALPPDERQRLAAEGYVPGLVDPDPSVGAYTTLTGTFAVSELLDRLFGFSGDDPPSELLVRLHDRMLSTTSAAAREGHYCADRAVWGRGDTDPFLEQLW